jgi:hypothetical protein
VKPCDCPVRGPVRRDGVAAEIACWCATDETFGKPKRLHAEAHVCMCRCHERPASSTVAK